MIRTPILLLILVSGVYIVAFGQTKHALLIGIGKYDPESGWPPISSANDIPLLREALLKRGFQKENIHVYIDTLDREGILNAMDNHLLKNVEAGDVVFFHFSGHGQQIVDNNADEVDGLDESLVPFDAPVRNELQTASGTFVPYHFDRHLRDDDLGSKLTEIRHALGSKGNILVSIDACHSATLTRGFGKARGTGRPNVPDDWVEPSFNNNNGKQRERGEFGLESTIGIMASMTCFYGSDQLQSNYEYICSIDSTAYGSLSYALSTALNNVGVDISYRVLFEQVQAIMSNIAPNQSPRVEGNLDQVIFGGQLLKSLDYYRIIQVISDSSYLIDAGYLLNINEGSKIGFYNPDTREANKTKTLATGRVINAHATHSLVVLNTGQTLSSNQVLMAWCIPLEINYGSLTINMHMDAKTRALLPNFEEKLKENSFIITAPKIEEAELLLTYDKNPDSNQVNKLILQTASEIILTDKNYHPSQLYQHEIFSDVVEAARQYAQSSFLRSLSVTNPKIHAEVSIVPRKIKPGFENKSPEQLEFIDDTLAMNNMHNGNYEIEDGGYVQFNVRNLSPTKIYYTLFDLTPDFKFSEINLIYPNGDKLASEYVLPPYGYSHGETFSVIPPYGVDQLVLIVSPRPLDMKSIVSSRGIRNKGTGSAIETLIGSSFNADLHYKGETPNIKPDEIGIYSKAYRIVPKKNI